MCDWRVVHCWRRRVEAMVKMALLRPMLVISAVAYAGCVGCAGPVAREAVTDPSSPGVVIEVPTNGLHPDGEMNMALLQGPATLVDGCLTIGDGTGPTVRWPQGTAVSFDDGQVVVLDRDGSKLFAVGDQVDLTGGFATPDGSRCNPGDRDMFDAGLATRVQ